MHSARCSASPRTVHMKLSPSLAQASARPPVHPLPTARTAAPTAQPSVAPSAQTQPLRRPSRVPMDDKSLAGSSGPTLQSRQSRQPQAPRATATSLWPSAPAPGAVNGTAAALVSLLDALAAQQASTKPSSELEQRLQAEMQASQRLSSQLATAQSEVHTLRNALDEERRRAELLRSSNSAHCFSQGYLYERLQERDQEVLALRLRIEKIKQDPTSVGRDLDTDPTVQRDARSVVRDSFVKQLRHENAALLQQLRDLRVQLDTYLGASA